MRGQNPEDKKIKQYKLLEVIGKGGMGKVYKALDTNMQRIVALKVMLDKNTNSGRKRFEREAQTMAKLNHKNILEVYESGVDQEMIFIAMPYIEGSSLRDVNSKTLPVRKIVELIAQVAEAIDHAHKNGVIHRDLKPDNILLDGETPKVMDFGLAKISAASQKLSQTNQIIGTISYMSPEQVAGEKLSASADIYALGVILYELLTGKLPIQASNFANLMLQMMKSSIIPPSQLNRKVSKELEVICLKALEKKPQDRYDSARAFARDLRKFLSGRSTLSASSKSIVYNRTKKIIGRYKHPLVMVLILVLAIVFRTTKKIPNIRYQLLMDDRSIEEIEAANKKPVRIAKVDKKSPEKIEPKPEEIKPKPEEIEPKPEEIKPKPEEIEPKPEEIKPKPEEIKPKPEEIKPKWAKKIKFKAKKKSLTDKEIYKILDTRGIEHGKIKRFAKHHYLIIKKPHTYEAAQKLCKDLGGYLLTITDQRESNFLTSLDFNENHYWIGLVKDKNNPRKFEWCTGERVSHWSSYLGFIDTFGADHEDVAKVYIAGDKKLAWWPFDSFHKVPFICEWGKKRRSKTDSKERDVLAQIYYNQPKFSFGITTNYNKIRPGWSTWFLADFDPIEFECTLFIKTN